LSTGVFDDRAVSFVTGSQEGAQYRDGTTDITRTIANRKTLPGSPDLVFASRSGVILVHGCSWHGHDCKRGRRVPKSNRAYWTAKINFWECCAKCE
jgi:DNA mismatch endonuclease (patch repair protein)